MPSKDPAEDNHFIEAGYRAASTSFQECFASWGYLHNETINIWSHLIGAALFVALPVCLYKAEIPPRYAVTTKEDIVVCGIYFVGVTTCFCLSALYHTIMNHSQQMDRFGAQLDFQGVIFLMWGATVPLVYYGFYCDSATHSYFYWALLSLSAIACSISTFQPRFRDPYLRPVRAATFGSLAVFTMVPVIHGAIVYGWRTQNQPYAMKRMSIPLFGYRQNQPRHDMIAFFTVHDIQGLHFGPDFRPRSLCFMKSRDFYDPWQYNGISGYGKRDIAYIANEPEIV
ncbi:hypothetical protein EYC80_005989 [Monilinia laxa]|uniref:Uncharacterized protein n=1 Tax=Monilinia laxa TaxID=61186 RepID=A0A5N6KHB1_MONLA|nr:hypothetical protein EYC80_005989 [Monilinia laxa]